MPETYFDIILNDLNSKKLLLNKGDNLFLQGETVVNLYSIRSGIIKLARNTIEGSPVIIHIAYSKETIAEPSLFSDNYHCTATAMANTELQLIDKGELLSYLDDNPVIMKKLLALFSRQVRDLRMINEIKNIHSAKERILTFFRSIMDEHKEVKLSLSGKDIAHKIGLAHETYYRELKALELSKLLVRKGKRTFLL